ncbi:hypothetical protein PIB30_076239 [Stylosanthes scabra]|uniref:Uncharacterized protein n=1 Tax=Stylosanthes scabra TaxID=79078 RepID=A0ABU6ZNS2_9FABA|nr:hypothetical protein [Stylosanthes scabra]
MLNEVILELLCLVEVYKSDNLDGIISIKVSTIKKTTIYLGFEIFFANYTFETVNLLSYHFIFSSQESNITTSDGKDNRDQLDEKNTFREQVNGPDSRVSSFRRY